jgi:hypothetical protein
MAGIAILVGVNRNRFGMALGIATALLGLLVAKDAIWFHYQDAIAYHPNLKQHVAPIDQKTPAPKRTRAPAPVQQKPVAPASRSTQPLSAPTTRIDRSSTPPPQLPIGPKKRPIKPLQ